MYVMLKHTHMLFALITILGFILRTGLAFKGSALLQNKFIKVAPHVIDSLFLASAIALMVVLQQYPFIHSWVTAKLFGLIAYIILGSLTLKHAKNAYQRTAYFAAALLVFAYIVGVARSKDIMFFLI